MVRLYRNVSGATITKQYFLLLLNWQDFSKFLRPAGPRRLPEGAIPHVSPYTTPDLWAHKKPPRIAVRGTNDEVKK
jgi:hypothetical protein